MRNFAIDYSNASVKVLLQQLMVSGETSSTSISELCELTLTKVLLTSFRSHYNNIEKFGT